MTAFKLTIVTPDGVKFSGDAEELCVRTAEGEVGILARHTDFVAPLGMGSAEVHTADGVRRGACIGGMVSVLGGEVTLVPTTFEWADEIDVSRAEASAERARRMLESKTDETQLKLADARLKRALVRISAAK